MFTLAGDAEIKVNPENKNQLLLPNGLIADMNGNNFTVQPKAQFTLTIWGDGFVEGDKLTLKLNIGSPLTGVLATCEGDYFKVK